nr:MAG TPA: hypothetical protein [Caudoviricetes sp.]
MSTQYKSAQPPTQPLSFRGQSADWSWESASPVPKLPRQGEPR